MFSNQVVERLASGLGHILLAGNVLGNLDNFVNVVGDFRGRYLVAVFGHLFVFTIGKNRVVVFACVLVDVEVNRMAVGKSGLDFSNAFQEFNQRLVSKMAGVANNLSSSGDFHFTEALLSCDVQR